MKKFLYVLTIALGTCFAASAQTTQKSDEAVANDVNVEVKVGGQTVQSDAGETPKAGTTEAKACCSSKKGKETASKKDKSCCADGSKSSANCSDKKGHADAGTTKDHE